MQDMLKEYEAVLLALVFYPPPGDIGKAKNSWGI